jgi:hypothetical protein
VPKADIDGNSGYVLIMRRLPISLICIAACLGGCDYESGFRGARDYPSPIDIRCVERALQKEFGEVPRYNYVQIAAGGPFPKGTSVTEFVYHRRPEQEKGYVILSVANTKSGARVSHSFSRIGAEIPETDFPPALAAMRQASSALRASCGLNISGMKMPKVRSSWALPL